MALVKDVKKERSLKLCGIRLQVGCRLRNDIDLDYIVANVQGVSCINQDIDAIVCQEQRRRPIKGP
jgi:hypothetical protein